MNETQVIRAYLTAIRSPQTIDRATIDSRLRVIDSRLGRADLDVLERLKLIQERLDRVALLNSVRAVDDLTNDFVSICRSYSDRIGITYDAWRELGVPPGVLASAGIRPGPSAAPPRPSSAGPMKRVGLPGRVGAERIDAMAAEIDRHLRDVGPVEVGPREAWHDAVRHAMNWDGEMTESAIGRAVQRLIDNGAAEKVSPSRFKVDRIEAVEGATFGVDE